MMVGRPSQSFEAAPKQVRGLVVNDGDADVWRAAHSTLRLFHRGYSNAPPWPETDAILRPVSEWQTTAIPGVLRDSVHAVQDRRGSFTELWRASRWEGVTQNRFVQANLSRSEAGVLRGMHFHRRQADLWILADGRATVAVCDLRPILDGGQSSPATLTFDMTPGDAVFIPEGVAHGFHAPVAMSLVYLVTNEYDGTDELGFMWNDPVAAIDWPVTDPVLSDRDAANPSLEVAVELLAT